MSGAGAAVRVDARGLRCPWPALRLARALREGAGPVAILADDPMAPREMAEVAAAAGRNLVADAIDPVLFHVSARAA